MEDETLGQYLATQKEFTAVGILWILENLSMLLRWRIYGTWTLSYSDFLMWMCCALILVVPERETKRSKKKASIKPKRRYRKFGSLCLAGGLLAYCGWLLSDNPYDVVAWKIVSITLGWGIGSLLPRYQDQSEEGQKREEARLLSITLGIFLFGITLFFLVAQPFTLHQAERLAREKGGQKLTYLDTRTPYGDFNSTYREDNPTELEQETGYYEFETPTKSIRVYLATGKVIID